MKWQLSYSGSKTAPPELSPALADLFVARCCMDYSIPHLRVWEELKENCGASLRGLRAVQRRHAELVDPQRGWLFKERLSASPRQNCTRGRCSRRRSTDRGPGQAWPVRRPARPRGSPPGSSAIVETSIRCADSPSPTSCCRPPHPDPPPQAGEGRVGAGESR